MKAIPTSIPEVLILEPRVFTDSRGWFMESYNRREFSRVTGVETEFVQDNHSRSTKNVLRGLHYQLRQPQGKLIRVLAGTIWDVAVDLRRSSPSYAKWVGCELSADLPQMVWIPPGFAHGFLVLSGAAEVLYKTTDFYAPQDERAVRWNDPALDIRWPFAGEPLIAEKDRSAPILADAEAYP